MHSNSFIKKIGCEYMNSVILREMLKVIIPFIQMFGVYVMFFGHLSPGGGFAGGTIAGASLILYSFICPKEKLNEILAVTRLMRIMATALIFYGLLKGYYFLGDNFHLPVLPLGKAGNIISAGAILPLNIAVGVIVSITVYLLFNIFNSESL